MDADHPRTTPTGAPSAVDRAERALADARGGPADARWGTAAVGRLLLDGVGEPHLLRALEAVADQVRRSGEGPGDLFGDPRVWAREQQERWLEEGVDAAPEDPLETPRQVVVGSLVAATIFAVLMALVGAVSGAGRASLGWSGLVLPVALGVAVVGAHTAYRRVRRARSSKAALVLIGAGVVVLSTGLAYVLVEAAPQPADGVSVWWLLAVAGVSAGLAVVVGSLPGRPGAAPRTADGAATDDDRRCRELAVALRDRGGFPDRRVDQLVEEARAHGADSGRPFAEEFGPARLHAQRYAPNSVVADRRNTILWAAVTVFPVVRLVDHVREEGWAVAVEPVLLALWGAATLVLAAHHARRWWRTRHHVAPTR